MQNSKLPKAVREAEGYYEDFIEKFKPKKTTDDCYTPENIYQAVRDFVISEYGIPENVRIVRPFWPGGDYTAEDYSGDCVVIDNPPFSILSQICRWYMENGVRFFLFAPALSLFGVMSGALNYIVSGAQITYENGATVNTSFITNMGDDKVYCCPKLNETIRRIDLENRKERTSAPPTYGYPNNVCSAARLNYISNHGAELRIKSEDVQFIRALDSQRRAKKAIFGGGFLLSNRAAPKKAAAEKAAEKAAVERDDAILWELSAREWEIIESMDQRQEANG